MQSQFRMLREPHITEKTTLQKELSNKVVFRVPKNVNKNEIKKAIKAIFNITVESVQTINVKGKVKRQGKSVGKRSDWKKAIVTLKPDDTIEYFEGA